MCKLYCVLFGASHTCFRCHARIPQHQQHWSFVASVNKLTANPPCYKSCLSRFSALQTIKQTNIPVQPHCTVISCIVTVYSPKWILYTIWYRYWFTWALAELWRSNSNNFIKKPEQRHSKRAYTLTRSASSPIHDAAEPSSSSITYIFMSNDCFIRDACVRHCPSSKQTKNNTSQSATPSERNRTLNAHILPPNTEVWHFTPLTGSLKLNDM